MTNNINNATSVKPFDRSMLVSFYESYLQPVRNIKERYGAEKGYDAFMALIEYGLYEKLSGDPIIDDALEYTRAQIDRSQAKRRRSYENYHQING